MGPDIGLFCVHYGRPLIERGYVQNDQQSEQIQNLSGSYEDMKFPAPHSMDHLNLLGIFSKKYHKATRFQFNSNSSDWLSINFYSDFVTVLQS